MIWQLFLVFFIIGAFTFGGGLAMLPLIHKEVVEKRKWVSEDEILDYFALAQSTPGVIAANVAVYIGKSKAGLLGAIAAVAGVTLPAFISIILIMVFLAGFRENVHVGKAFSGIKAAAAALILLAAVRSGKSSVRNGLGIFIAAVSFAMVIVFGLNAALAVLFGGVAGYLSYFLNRRRQKC
jgi:chromate transporter